VTQSWLAKSIDLFDAVKFCTSRRDLPRLLCMACEDGNKLLNLYSRTCI